MSTWMAQESLTLRTSGRGLHAITAEVQGAVCRSGIRRGIAHLFIHHTSASLVISENADGQVLRDLEAFMTRLVPDGDALFRHLAEGPDDMPAHVRSVLTCTDLQVPVRDGRCALGVWQGIFVWEHRRDPHRREVTVTVCGDAG